MVLRSKIKSLSHVQQLVVPSHAYGPHRSGAISTDKQAKPNARTTDLQCAQDKLSGRVCAVGPLSAIYLRRGERRVRGTGGEI